MGYTHYWELKKGNYKLTKKCIADIGKVLEEHKDIIQFEHDIKEPIVLTENMIRFNGIEEDGHETFYVEVPPKEGDYSTFNKEGFMFSFCKTARKPYDIVVCKVLLILKAHLKDKIKLSSDGFSNAVCSFDECWNDAIESVKRLGYKIDCKVFSRDEGDSIYYDCEITNIDHKGKYVCGEWKSSENTTKEVTA